MLLASGPTPWYDTGATAAILAFLLLVATVWIGWTGWVTYRSNRRDDGTKLTYRVFPQQLLPANAAALEVLEVRYQYQTVADPMYVSVRLSCKGRRDIPTAAFDAGKPLVLDLGIPIIALLAGSATLDQQAVRIEGSELRFMPQLIRHNQDIRVYVLASGKKIAVRSVSPLIDVDVAEETDQEPRRRMSVPALASIALLAVCAIIVPLVPAPPKGSSWSAVGTALVATVGVLFVVAMALALLSTPRKRASRRR